MLLWVPLSLFVGGTVTQFAGTKPGFSSNDYLVEGAGQETLIADRVLRVFIDFPLLCLTGR